MRRAILVAVLLAASWSDVANGAPNYPSCILQALSGQPQAQWALIYNVTKMCLEKEQVPIPPADLEGLKGLGAYVWGPLYGQVFRITLTNDTTYILTELTVSIEHQGVVNTAVSNGFNAVFHGTGVLTGPGADISGDRTIRPFETREFDVAIPDSVTAPISNWRIVSAKGIPE